MTTINELENLTQKLRYFEREKRELGTDTIRIAHGHNHYILDDKGLCKDFKEKLTKLTVSFIDEQIETLEKQINSLFKN